MLKESRSSLTFRPKVSLTISSTAFRIGKDLGLGTAPVESLTRLRTSRRRSMPHQPWHASKAPATPIRGKDSRGGDQRSYVQIGGLSECGARCLWLVNRRITTSPRCVVSRLMPIGSSRRVRLQRRRICSAHLRDASKSSAKSTPRARASRASESSVGFASLTSTLLTRACLVLASAASSSWE